MTSTRTEAATGYRADIDGLRAISVLAVILFHINPAWVPGGFVGVDIFFVISGYLITGHMAGELSAGRFSLGEFYRRRIKRIMPAMLAVVAVTLAVGCALLLPEDLADLAKSAFWSIASMANIYFWREVKTDYFSPGSESLPLLHLWSLGVEEQFYLLWPLALMLIWKATPPALARRRALWLAVSLVPLSCLLTAWLYERDGMFVYYMLPTRAGELGIGATLALMMQGRESRESREEEGARTQAGLLALIGAVLVGASLVLLSEAGPFPGWRSLPPTLGAALIIAAGTLSQRHWLAPALSLRGLVWVGAISYSAYLWHWPVLAYWRYLFGQPGGLLELSALVVILLLAWCSYRWIEQPARTTQAPLRAVLLRHYLVPGGLLAGLALMLVFGPRLGLPWPSERFQAELKAVREQAHPAYRFPWACQHSRLGPADLADPRCVLGQTAAGAPQVLLWGDSNAAHYIPMLDTIARAGGYGFRNIEIGSCPPLLGEVKPFVVPDRYRDCADSLAHVQAALAAYPVIILAGSWTDYQQRSPDFLARLEATIEQLRSRGHELRLLGKVPLFEGFDRRCAEKAVKLPWLDCAVPSRPLPQDVAATNEALRQLAARHPGVVYLDMNDHLCPGGACSITDAGGRRLYYDPGHLSVYGSTELGRQVLAREGVPGALNFSGRNRQ